MSSANKKSKAKANKLASSQNSQSQASTNNNNKPSSTSSSSLSTQTTTTSQPKINTNQSATTKSDELSNKMNKLAETQQPSPQQEQQPQSINNSNANANTNKKKKNKKKKNKKNQQQQQQLAENQNLVENKLLNTVEASLNLVNDNLKQMNLTDNLNNHNNQNDDEDYQEDDEYENDFEQQPDEQQQQLDVHRNGAAYDDEEYDDDLETHELFIRPQQPPFFNQNMISNHQMFNMQHGFHDSPPQFKPKTGNKRVESPEPTSSYLSNKSMYLEIRLYRLPPLCFEKKGN